MEMAAKEAQEISTSSQVHKVYSEKQKHGSKKTNITIVGNVVIWHRNAGIKIWNAETGKKGTLSVHVKEKG